MTFSLRTIAFVEQGVIFWSFSVLFLTGVSRGTEGPTVQTEYGPVRGTIKRAIGSIKPVYSYFGVQYGRSPDYVFRFRPAEDPWPWDEVRDATNENRPLCVQDRDRCGDQGLQKHTFLRHIMPELNMRENCLVVDIFSPREPNNTKSLLPVILWFHGGSMTCFASSMKLWVLPAYEDVVLVQIQYRLDLFGFFTTEDEWAPPNVAFHDHLKAMRWVQRNIRAFGGDPNLVTLMGESAGAVAVTAHTLMPASKGLFHRVYAASGAPNSMEWSTYGDSVKRIAEKTNCEFEHSGATSTCLRNKVSTSRLMSVAKELDINFSLLEDHTLFPGSIRSLIESKLFASPVPLMIGVTNGEQNFLLPRRVFADVYFKGTAVTRQEIKRALCRFLISFYPRNKIDEIADVVLREYADPSKIGDEGIELFRGFLNAIADGWFVSRAVRYAEKMKGAGQQVYFFKFSLKPSMYDAKIDEFVRPYNFTTMDHGDDLLYTFGFPFVPDLASGKNPALIFTDEERELSRKYMRVISHFAKTGSPPEDVDWPQYPDYVQITSAIEAKRELRTDRMHLWNEVIAELAYGTEG